LAAASFTWLDLTADDRDKVRRVLDLFNEQGLGSLRDMISNALFPGTSVLHTRLTLRSNRGTFLVQRRHFPQ